MHTHTRAHTRTHATHARARTHKHTHTHTHTRTHTHIQTPIAKAKLVVSCLLQDFEAEEEEVDAKSKPFSKGRKHKVQSRCVG